MGLSCAHNLDARRDGAVTLKHVCEHQRAVFGEGVRQLMGKFESGEVVTVCDHLLLLVRCESEHEVGRKPLTIAFHGLIKGLGADIIQFRQVTIDQDSLGANEQDCLIDPHRLEDNFFFRGHDLGSLIMPE